jgi:predicted hotdog family 3-hydroxylacyl-ACP dehydratase
MTAPHPEALNREQIAALIPHAGSMCLLERVVSWSEGEIHCEATGHRAADNPLRSGDLLPVSAGIEYAAQAMAVHGGLVEPPAGAPRRGYLAVLSHVHWLVQRLDDRPQPLQIAAFRQTAIAGGTSYDFQVSAGGELLLRGSAVIALE